MSTKLRICWFGIYDPKYPRNDILMRGLRAEGVGIVECQADWRDPARFKILRKKLKELEGTFDVIYAAYPSNTPVLLAKLVSRKPVVMDALYSMYDSVVNDRREVPWYHPRAIRLFLSDWLAALVCDFMVTDTKAHVAYWSRLPGIRASKMAVVYTGVQDYIFSPQENVSSHGTFLVSFHGFYIPLQGVTKIVEAAQLLAKEKDIRFRLIGSGHDSDEVDRLIKLYHLTNIEQVGRVPVEQVSSLSKEADVILGIFGDTEKASRVVPNKVYEGLALRKPVITMDTPSVREVFSDEELMLIENTPEALAKAIMTLRQDPVYRARLATTGYARVVKDFYPRPLARLWLRQVETFLGAGR